MLLAGMTKGGLSGIRIHELPQIMLMMTGLSENDLGELNADDAAEVSKLIFSAMKKYMDLGKQIVQSMNE